MMKDGKVQNLLSTSVKGQIFGSIRCTDLRVVQTQVILFFKSMSERVGSDLQRI